MLDLDDRWFRRWLAALYFDDLEFRRWPLALDLDHQWFRRWLWANHFDSLEFLRWLLASDLDNLEFGRSFCGTNLGIPRIWKLGLSGQCLKLDVHK